MRVFAAVDLRGGGAVQLVGGDPGTERVRLPDPAAVARRWLDAGFRGLHLVDLDAALGQGDNAAAVRAVVDALLPPRTRDGAGARDDRTAGRDAGTRRPRALLQIGGGLRDGKSVRRALGLGGDRAVVGTRAVEDRRWLERVARAWPGRLVVAADVGGGDVLSRGWTRSTGRAADRFLAGLDPLPLAAVLVTDVDREGREAGVDDGMFRRLARATRHPLMAAGGIASADDLRRLADAGVDGAVVGMALYTGRIDPADALELEEQ